MFGSNEGNKSVKPNSRRRVLKPPGGGSSDIFGTSAESAEPQRKVKNHHLTSSIFGEETVTSSRNKAGNDSFYNLFGNEPEDRPASAFKDKSISNILNEPSTNSDMNASKRLNLSNTGCTTKIESATSRDSTINSNESCDTLSNSDPDNNDLHRETDETLASEGMSERFREVSAKRPDGNTSGDSSSKAETPSVVNGASSSSNSTAPTPTPTPTAAPAPANKQRVPPGGFSSGLW